MTDTRIIAAAAATMTAALYIRFTHGDKRSEIDAPEVDVPTAAAVLRQYAHELSPSDDALRVASQQGEIARLRAELQDRQHAYDVAFRFWQSEFGDIDVTGDPRGEFDREFRALAKRLGMVPTEPTDLDPDGT